MKLTATHKLTAGILFFLFSFYAFCTWIFVFNKYPNLQERNSHFTDHIFISENPVVITMLSIILAVASIILLGRAKPENTILKLVIYSIIAMNVFLLVFNIWGLL